MSETITVRDRITCPACNGRGKSYGYRYCGRCKGRNVVTEKKTIKKEASSTVIRERVTCPACNGRGKSYGERYCGRCKGRNVVTEKRRVER